MSIGGKQFNMDMNFAPPCFRLDIVISSPDKSIDEHCVLNDVLIDTGSDFTLIPYGVIEILQLKWTGTEREIESFTGEISIIRFYSAMVIVEGVMEEFMELGAIDSDPIIGMDLITKWHLLLNCPNGVFEIATTENYKTPTN